MNYNKHESIFQYATNLGCQKTLTFFDVFYFLLKDINCIIYRESAADLLGYTLGGFVNKIYVYSKEELNIPHVICHIIDNFDYIKYQDFKGLKVTTINDAIIDMLTNEDCDPEILYQTFANYYCENHDSYYGLIIPLNLEEKANHYKIEGTKYYDFQ